MKSSLIAVFLALIIQSYYVYAQKDKQTLFVGKVNHLLQSKSYNKFNYLKCDNRVKLPSQLLAGESYFTAVRVYKSRKHLAVLSEFEIGICMESLKEKEKCAIYPVINQGGTLCITSAN